MSNTEHELLDLLAKAEEDWQHAKISLADAKKKFTEAETKAINAKLHKEKMVEMLRVFRAQQVIPGEEYAMYDSEDGGS